MEQQNNYYQMEVALLMINLSTSNEYYHKEFGNIIVEGIMKTAGKPIWDVNFVKNGGDKELFSEPIVEFARNVFPSFDQTCEEIRNKAQWRF